MDKELGKKNRSSQVHQTPEGRHIDILCGSNPWTYGLGKIKELILVETTCLKLTGWPIFYKMSA